MLENIAIFAGLSQTERQILEQHMVKRTFQKNTVVINEGDEANSLFIIIEGTVKVFLSNEEGREIIINTQGPGDHFGELALLDDEPRSASVMTLSKSSIGVISKADFQSVLSKHPELAIKLLTEMTRRVRLLSDNIKTLALMDVYGRVAKTLLSLAEQVGEVMVIRNRPTQQDIANRIGASREIASGNAVGLPEGQMVTIDGRQLTINEKLPAAY